MIETLIDKQDNFEVVRDQIAGILKLEITNQQVLAAAALKDPDEWKLRIYTERSNAFEQFLNEQTDKSPIVNVWYDSSTFDESKGNTVSRQYTEGVFNIDCIGYGVSADEVTGGHVPGDRDAAFEVQKAVRLVRNILMAAEYTYLGLRGVVGQRWPLAVNMLEIKMQEKAIQKIVGARLALRVRFNEFSPQFVPETLEHVAIEIERAEDGEIVLQADYDYS